MILLTLQMLAGFFLLTWGAGKLVDGSSSLALKVGMSPLVIGITVVAFGTSAPELVVSIRATLDGSSEIAIGNVIGSNIANIALILGATALLRPMTIHKELLRVEVPLMIGITLFASIFILDDVLDLWEGVALFTGLVLYIIFNLSRARKLPQNLVEQLVEKPDPDAAGTSLPWTIFWIIAGLGLLVFGGQLLVSAAIDAARMLGVSEAVIGITIVSVGTSLPELATSVVAAIKKEADIAVGNIIGSNVFNLLSILGITAMIHPLDSSSFLITDLAVMLGLTILILPMMRHRMELNRYEGAILLLVYFSYLTYLLLFHP